MLFTFLVYVVLVILRPHEFVEALTDLDLPRYVLLLSFVIWLFRPGKILSAPQQVLVPVFCLLAVVSRAALGWLGGVTLALGELIPLIMFFLVCTTVMEDEARATTVLKVTCLCTLVLVLHGLDQVANDGIGWTGETMVIDDSGGRRIRYIGVFSDPNDLSLLFVACIPFCIYLASKAGTLFRLFWWGAAAFIGYGIYLTNSRGGLLAMLAVIGLWSTRRLGKVFTTVSASLVLPFLFAATRLAGLSAGEESAAGRVDAWYTALQLFLERPITGVGMGLFTEHNDLTAHNSWLLVLAETGFFGYIVWFSVVAISVHQMYVIGNPNVPRVRDGSESVETKTADGRLAMTMFYTGVGTLIGAFFLSRSYSLIFFLLWGWTAGVYNGARLRDPSIRSLELTDVGSKWALIAVISIPAFYVIVRVLLVV